MSKRHQIRVAGPDELRSSREAWNALVSTMRFPTPFATWEWLRTWEDQFAKQGTTQTLFVHYKQQLCAVLPLYQPGADRFGGWWGKGSLELAGVGELYPDHLDLIARPEHAEASVRAIWTYLRETEQPWDVVRLSMLAEDSTLLTALRHQIPPSRLLVRPVSVAPYTLCATGFDDFMQSLSRNERQKLRSRRKKLLEQQGVRYVAHDGVTGRGALETLYALHAARAGQKGIVSSFARPAVQAFHRRLLERMPAEWVMLRTLEDAGRPIASFYGFRLGNRVFYFQLGYDPAWSKASPGLVLLNETIREAFETGCVEYNFLQGDEGFKRIWAKDARVLYDAHVYNTTFGARIARNSLALKDRIKKIWRGSPAPVEA